MSGKWQNFMWFYSLSFIRLSVLFVLVLPFFAYGNNNFELDCGHSFTPKNISRLLLHYKGLKSVEVSEVMSSCPKDPVLERTLFILYSKEGACRTAFEFMEYKKAKGSKAFPSKYYHSDYEGVFSVTT